MLKDLIIQIARMSIKLRPEYHLLISIALLVSLIANLVVGFYFDKDSKRQTLLAAILVFISSILYIRIIHYINIIWQDAQRRGGIAKKKVIVDQLTRLASKENEIISTGCCMLCALVFFILAMLIVLFPPFRQLIHNLWIKIS